MSKICQITGKRAMSWKQRFSLKEKNETKVQCQPVYEEVLLGRAGLLG